MKYTISKDGFGSKGMKHYYINRFEIYIGVDCTVFCHDYKNHQRNIEIEKAGEDPARIVNYQLKNNKHEKNNFILNAILCISTSILYLR